jgi:uncharacterized damage-inducible protein DinB
VGDLWKNVTAYITTAAAEASEAEYAYRPVATVRSFGQLIGHIAGAQYMFCAVALGDPPREEDEVERTKTSKADLLAALRASTEYCGKAYGQSDTDAQQARLFGAGRAASTLGLNATHAEHYGSLVTYLRMQGESAIQPPAVTSTSCWHGTQYDGWSIATGTLAKTRELAVLSVNASKTPLEWPGIDPMTLRQRLSGWTSASPAG